MIIMEIVLEFEVMVEFVNISFIFELHYSLIINQLQWMCYNLDNLRYMSGMLLRCLQGKLTVIIGYQTLASRIIIKKILRQSNASVVCVQMGKQNSRRDTFISDPYFSLQEQRKLRKYVSFVSLEGLSGFVAGTEGKKIDFLLNLFEPVDFEVREKVVNYHLYATSSIVQALSKINIERCVLLSSIYFKEGGYVGEDDDFQDYVVQNRFGSREQALSYFRDNFVQMIQGWKWSIGYIEKSYYSICKKIIIVRVPSLGPTLTNYEGYALNFNYVTYLMHQMGLGKIKTIYGIRKNKVDIIPTDYLSNFVLALMNRNNDVRAETVNLSTSSRNYITLQQFVEIGTQAWEEQGYKPGKLKIVESKLQQDLRLKVEKLPSQLKRRMGSMLEIASWKIEGQRSGLEIDHRMSLINKYKYFLNQEWMCECIKAIDMTNRMKPEDQEEYCFNVNNINWKMYIRLCVYSIRKYLLNQQIEQFKPEAIDLLGKGKKESYFSDIMWALREGKNAEGQRQKDAVQFVLNSKAVKEAVKNLVEESMLKLQNAPISFEKAEEEMMKIAEEMCMQMFSDYSMSSIRVFGWFLHKLFRAIYERVVVDKSAIARIQGHDQNLGPLVIIPTHRSYIDFLIMSYVFFGYGIKCPHIAAAQDFLNMAVVHILLRRSGAFFIKRNQKKYKDLYRAVMNQYLSKLMVNNHYMQFFIEGTRSRTGKMLSPKFGILSVMANCVVEGKVKDAFILPVTINYERILQGNSFTYEMMGEAKVKESLSRVLKAADVLKENYGRIHLQFCDTISVRKWMTQGFQKQRSFNDIVAELGVKIVRQLSNRLVIAGPAIVSTVVLMNRRGISDDSLQEQSSWLAKQISMRGFKTTRSQADSSISVSSTLGLLEGILSKSQKDMFQVQVSFDQNSFLKLFTLTYYRNTLSHIFFEEAVIATTLASFGYKEITQEQVSQTQLFQHVKFVWSLFQSQFYLHHNLAVRERFDERINLMMNLGVLKLKGQIVTAINLTGNYFNFYWSLVWPLVDSYWITCLYLFKLLKNKAALPLPKFLSEIQWFGQSLINERHCDYLEAISSDTIKNAVAVFTKMKIIIGGKKEVNGEEVSAIRIGVDEQSLRNLLQRIERYRRSSYAKSLKGVLTSGAGSVNLDFPFLSRL